MFASKFKHIIDTYFPLVADHYKGSFEFNKYPELAERNFILWNSTDGLPGEHWRILYRFIHSLNVLFVS